MANDLATILASAGGDTTSSDPTLQAIAPRLKLAQLMSQGGLDTSPTGHPLQALARIAQAGAGQYVQAGAMSDLAKAYAGQAEAAAKALEKTAPGHPLIRALRSGDQNMQALALQQAGKALLALPEQQWERQKFGAQQGLEREKLNKPSFEKIGQGPDLVEQYGFVSPATKTVQPYKTPAPTAAALAAPKSAAEFEALPSGTKFTAPDGTVRVKP